MALEPVVAKLIANTSEFMASMQAAKAEMGTLSSNARVVGQDAGTALSDGLALGSSERLHNDESTLKQAGENAGGAVRSGVKDGAKDIENDLATTGERAGGKFNTAMKGPLSDLTNLFGSFGGQMPGVASKVEGVGGAMEKAGGQSGLLSGAIGGIPIPAVAAAAAVAALAAISIKMAIDYQAATNKIAASEGISTRAASNIGAAFLSTAGTTTFAAGQIANAFAGVAGQLKDMNGGALTGAQSLDVMRSAMDLAEATGTNLNTTTSGLVKIMQSFGISASQSAAASDVLFTAAVTTGLGIQGVTQEFQRIHTQLGSNAPDLQNMGALFKDMADHGEGGRGAVSALTTAFKNLVTPTAAAAAAQQQAGVAFTNSQGAMMPLCSIIDQLHTKIQGVTSAPATAELSTLGFGGASSKLVGIIQSGSGVYNADVVAMLQHGTAADAAAKATSGLGAQFEKGRATVEDYLTELGRILLPVITEVATVISGTLSGALKAMNEELKIEKGLWHDIEGPIKAVTGAMGGFFGSIEHAGASVFGFVATLVGLTKAHSDASQAAKDHTQTLDKLTSSASKSQSAADALKASFDKQGAAAGITGAQLEQLMLTTNTSADAVVKDLTKQAATAGIFREAITTLATDSGTSMATIAKNISSATTSANSSFQSSFSIVSSLGSQLSVSGADIANFYVTSVQGANTWTANIQQAIKDGYDPGVISGLITAGPKQAGTILQGMVANFSPQLVGIVNAGTSALSAAGAQAVEVARLTAEAVASKTSTFAAALPQAMAISQQLMANGGKAMSASFIASISGGLPAVQQIASEYGIALPSAVQAQIAAAQSTATTQAQAVVKGHQSAAPGSRAAGAAAGHSFINAIGALIPSAGQTGTDVATASKAGLGSVEPTSTGKAHAQKLINSIQLLVPNAGVTGQNLANATKIGASTIDPMPTGTTHAQKFIQGINNKKPDAGVSGRTLAQASLDSAAKVDGKPAGANIVTGIIQGVNSSQDKINTAVYNVVKAAESAVIPNVGGQGVGAAIDQGIALGINQNTGGINAAAAAAAQGAVTAAKTAIGAKSPSALAAREIGLPFVQGIAKGITDNMGLAHAAIGGLGANLTSSFNVGSGSSAVPVSAPTGSGGGISAQIVNQPINMVVNGQTLATIMTQFQLRSARAVGPPLGQWQSGQTGQATGINVNAVAR